MKHSPATLKKEILHIGKRIYGRGYIASNDGNISARVNQKHILITSTGISKGFMKSSDLILIDFNGKVIKGRKRPSSESLLHIQIYKDRPDVRSICHAHPPYATGFAVAGIPLNQHILPEVIISLGTIPLVPYGTPGTEELYKSILPFLKYYDAFLLSNHGVLTVGTSVLDAYNKMETVEHFAQILFISRQLGKFNTLSEEQISKLIRRRKVYGIRENVGMISDIK